MNDRAKLLIGHTMCADTIRKVFRGYRVVITDAIFEGGQVTVGRVVAALTAGESSHYEKRKGCVTLDLTADGEK